jgi:iron transport multicopper oxidase
MKKFRINREKQKFSGGAKPLFSSAGKSQAIAPDRSGIGTPTTTSFQGKAGTGIVWVCDPVAGLKAYHAVPKNGVLQPISIPAMSAGCNKFQRPAFGDGRVYVTDINGVLYCLAAH